MILNSLNVITIIFKLIFPFFYFARIPGQSGRFNIFFKNVLLSKDNTIMDSKLKVLKLG